MTENLYELSFFGKSYSEVQTEIIKLVKYYSAYVCNRSAYNYLREDIYSIVMLKLFKDSHGDGTYLIKRLLNKAQDENLGMGYVNHYIRKAVFTSFKGETRLPDKHKIVSLEENCGDRCLGDTIASSVDIFAQIEYEDLLEMLPKIKDDEYYIVCGNTKMLMNTRNIVSLMVDGTTVEDIIRMSRRYDGKDIVISTTRKRINMYIKFAKEKLKFLKDLG